MLSATDYAKHCAAPWYLENSRQASFLSLDILAQRHSKKQDSGHRSKRSHKIEERKEEKWEMQIMGLGYTSERQKLGRSRDIIKLVLERKASKLWEEAWTNEKTGRELHIICPKPTKKTLKIHRGLCKAASILIVQMQIKKIRLKRFLYFRKFPGFDSPECTCRRGLQSIKHLLVKCRLHTQKRNPIWEKKRKKVAFGRISREEMLTNPKFV